MPKRNDIKSILILGSGPIVIGQGCEFDYSGAQACKILRAEGYRIILVNSNPATIMTDPDMADATYIEPIECAMVADIIAKEQPDALLPTMGGQTALNCTLDLVRAGVLQEHKVELIGANQTAIEKAEDREQFRGAMHRIGLAMPRSAIANSVKEALRVQEDLGFPCIIRPSFTLGGSGGGIAYNREEFVDICQYGLELSPIRELLIDESILGWKEYEMEVIRDTADNCIIVCAIENLDPMGVHTGDSITVAPTQTLTDPEYQAMRNASIAVLREIGVDTGGANVQFAVNPKNGELVVIEMNPRVSRSSALASKATGFPIAKIAAKLAVGYTLDELRNEITQGKTPASFEPSIDYVITKLPRFNFEKFPNASHRLSTQMKSVGEVMGIGRTFQESLQKAIRSLEIGRYGLSPLNTSELPLSEKALTALLSHVGTPSPDRLWHVGDAFRAGLSMETIHHACQIDPWFLGQIKELIDTEMAWRGKTTADLDEASLRQLKRQGFSDIYIADWVASTEDDIRALRYQHHIKPVYKRIDTCAAEFPTHTAYLYSTYEPYCEARPTSAKKVIILGGGPNRIGQGIEFDYCCVHACMALREEGFETIMINCNPETVSTDIDTSDRLYFEPISVENILAIVEVEQVIGVVVHYGGQTPLKLARALADAGVPIIGTSPDAIDLAENRARFQQLIKKLDLRQPDNATANSKAEALEAAQQLTYPLIVRPSYVLGGRAMEIVHNTNDLRHYLQDTVNVSPESPLLIDKFLNEAIEVDIDAVCDGHDVLIGGIMEHIEQAGVHSGDSACTLPPFSLSTVLQEELKRQIRLIALELNVVGLLNAQFAIQADDIYILEVNPRASRTVPFVSKATGVPLAKIALKCKLGKSLKEQGCLAPQPTAVYYAVKFPVFPFAKFTGTDSVLGPEMKSTGEVMGIAKGLGQAFAKAQWGAKVNIVNRRNAFVSVRDSDKPRVGEVARRLVNLGFKVCATRGTAKVLKAIGIPCKRVNKVAEGRPHIVDMIKNDVIDFIVNTTTEEREAMADSFVIRHNALHHKVSYTTTLSGAQAACLAMKYEDKMSATCLQDIHTADKG